MPCTFGFGEVSGSWTLHPIGKCEFHQSKMEFLDYIIYGDGIHKDLCKVQTIVDWVTPTFVQNV